MGYKPHRLEPNYPGSDVVRTKSPAPPVVVGLLVRAGGADESPNAGPVHAGHMAALRPPRPRAPQAGDPAPTAHACVSGASRSHGCGHGRATPGPFAVIPRNPFAVRPWSNAEPTRARSHRRQLLERLLSGHAGNEGENSPPRPSNKRRHFPPERGGPAGAERGAASRRDARCRQ